MSTIHQRRDNTRGIGSVSAFFTLVLFVLQPGPGRGIRSSAGAGTISSQIETAGEWTSMDASARYHHVTFENQRIALLEQQTKLPKGDNNRGDVETMVLETIKELAVEPTFAQESEQKTVDDEYMDWVHAQRGFRRRQQKPEQRGLQGQGDCRDVCRASQLQCKDKCIRDRKKEKRRACKSRCANAKYRCIYNRCFVGKCKTQCTQTIRTCTTNCDRSSDGQARADCKNNCYKDPKSTVNTCLRTCSKTTTGTNNGGTTTNNNNNNNNNNNTSSNTNTNSNTSSNTNNSNTNNSNSNSNTNNDSNNNNGGDTTTDANANEEEASSESSSSAT